MRPIFFLPTAVFLASTSAFPFNGPLGISIHKRSNPTNDGIVDLNALGSHIAYVQGKYSQRPAANGNTPARRGVATEPLVDWKNSLWYGNISLGTPAVEFTVDIDTGSSDLYLPAYSCDWSCDGHNRYNPDASSSAVDLHRNSSLLFGNGTAVVVEHYTDTVTLAGFTVKNQTVGAAKHYTQSLSSEDFGSDGLLGMAFQNISALHAKPFIQTLVEEGQLSEPVFAVKLASHGSELRIGGVNTTLYKGNFTYTPVVQQGYWQIQADSMNANGQEIFQNVSAIVDTGTTLIIGDMANVAKFYSTLNATSIGEGFYALPCNAIPDVSITIAGKSLNISSEIFNLGWIDASKTTCLGGIAGVSVDSLGDMWILGDVFIRNYYTVFDLGQLQVGFADLA